jgi:hypothetical protein
MIMAGTETGSIQTAEGETRRPIRWLRVQENNTDIADITGGDIPGICIPSISIILN